MTAPFLQNLKIGVNAIRTTFIQQKETDLFA